MDWRIFSGDEIATLFGWHRLQKAKGRFIHDRLPMGSDEQMVKRLKAAKNNWYFIASAVSSKILKTMASMEGMRFEVRCPVSRFAGSGEFEKLLGIFFFQETLTGFKFMASRARDLESQTPITLDPTDEELYPNKVP